MHIQAGQCGNQIGAKVSVLSPDVVISETSSWNNKLNFLGVSLIVIIIIIVLGNNIGRTWN